MRHSIALRLLAFFALALLLFALVLGLLFGRLFQQAVLDGKKAEMLERAQTLSLRLGEMLEGAGGRGMGGPGGYGASVRALTELSQDLWVLDENLQVLSAGRMMGKSLAGNALPPAAEQLVEQAFAGKAAFSEGFSQLMGYPSLTLGYPIYQQGQVQGALLIHGAVAGISAATAQGQQVLVYASLIALFLASLLSIGLSYGFTRPIKRMQQVAFRLAKGDYSARTGLLGRDEIAGLAQSIDQLSQRLQDARDAKDRQEQQRRDFLANVSHELRTPVTVLRGSLEALRDGVVSSPQQVQAYHSQMLLETQGLQRLVNDLMELARLQNADFKIQAEPLILQQVAQDARRSASQLALKKNITIKADLSPLPIPWQGDAARLKQMLMIVLDNAIKFSPTGSLVLLALDPSGFTITDQGPGMTREQLSHLFDRFQKSTGQENQTGSGLGLAIARQIALRHGMDITVSSTPGQGSSVRIAWAPLS